ncbi:MAG: glycosyltransferase family 2 protein [Desulfovibrio sp.]
MHTASAHISSPKVSVVVPTYNQAEYLAACLDSLFFQEYENLQIIVVADPSPDNTSQVLQDFVAKVGTAEVSSVTGLTPDGELSRTTTKRYPQHGRELIIIENKERQGHTPSYNIGFKQADGEYCTYVASDDICHPQMLSTMVESLENNDVDFVYSDMFIINDAGEILRRFSLPDYSFEASFCQWYLLGVSKLYRRELHEKFGYYDPQSTFNDHECYLRFAMNGVSFLHIPHVLYSVRSHDQHNRQKDVHASDTYNKKLQKESGALVQKAKDFLKNNR